jgi:hypothetical protein
MAANSGQHPEQSRSKLKAGVPTGIGGKNKDPELTAEVKKSVCGSSRRRIVM